MEFTYCKLNNVLKKVYSGGTPSTEIKEYWNGNIKWLSSGETSQRFISDTISKITELGVQKSSTKLATKNSIVMACAGQGKTRGQTSFLLDDMYINQSIIVMQTNSKILPLYLFYNLSSRYEELRGGSDASSTRGSITTVKLKKLSFKYPDIDIQKKIVTFLNNYDQVIENNNKRIKLLEDMAESIYKEWFVRFRFPGYENAEFENGIPRGWEIKRIADFGDVKTGKTPSTEVDEYYGNEYLFVKTPDMHSNFMVINSGEKLSELGNKVQKNCLLPPYSIMVSCIGTGGVTAINYYPAQTNQQINSIILKNMKQLEWLYLQVKSMKETIITFGNTGSTMTNLSKGKFQKLKLIMPTNDLIDKFSSIVKPLLEQEINYLKQNELLSKQRDSLLPRLMSGKLSMEGKEVI